MADRETLQAGAPHASMIAQLFSADAPLMALPGETCRAVATRLAAHGLERLPVVSDLASRRLVGIVTPQRPRIKPSLGLLDEEHRRQRYFSWRRVASTTGTRTNEDGDAR